MLGVDIDWVMTQFKFNLQTFFFKSRCKHCASKPKYLFFYANKHCSYEQYILPRQFAIDNYQNARSWDLSFVINNRSFSSTYVFDGLSMMYRKAKLPGAKHQPGTELISVLECQCGRTRWEFTQSIRQHVKFRKIDRKIPMDGVVFSGFRF